MSNLEKMVPVYLENTHWPIMLSSDGRSRRAGDSAGDILCPFCDHVVVTERTPISLGDKCKKCRARVVRIEPFVRG